MPTTISFVSPETTAELLRSESRPSAGNSDLLVAALFSAIGIGLTVGLALLFPLAANAAALIWTVT